MSHRLLMVHPQVLEARRALVAELVARFGLDDRAVLVPRSAIAARYRASEAVRRGARDLLVAGGDGTIHAVLPALVGHPTRLGIVPCGTSNDLAKSVGMASAPHAIEALAAGRSAPLDLLRIGTHWVATAGGFGLAAQIADAANRWRAQPWRRSLAAPIGAQLYAVVAAAEILRRRPRPVGLRLRVDGALWEPCTATAILVSRVPTFGGGLRLGRAPLASGTFTITVVTAGTRARLIRTLLALRQGRPCADARTATEVSSLDMQADGLLGAFGDGEPLGIVHRLRIRSVAGAARVIVPATAARADGVRHREAV